ncbi:hypothetical protein ABPG72_015737 [Tetrahymena utriculariae]
MIKEIVLFGAFQAIGIYTWIQTSKQIRQPYMDEYFHLDQLDHYLNGDWTYWNDKLTTPPGTYLLLYPFLKLGQLLGFKNTLLGARLLNSQNNQLKYKYNFIIHCVDFHRFLLGSAILVFLKKVLREINSKENVFLSYYVLFTPTIYFFSHLFYTDSASLAICLGMYYYSKKQKFTLSGLLGLISILIRQTNVIWILYICFITFIDSNHKAFQEKSMREILINIQFTCIQKIGFMHSSKSLIGLIFKNIFNIIRMYKMQIVLVTAFACFIIYNGSIVLGDKQNHESSFHPTQLLYLSLFSFLNLPLSVKGYFSNFKDTLKNQKIVFFIILVISLGVIHKFTEWDAVAKVFCIIYFKLSGFIPSWPC